MRKKLREIYDKLHREFGPQGWWPAETPFEVMVGAILTQNTSWQNAEKAIAGLKKRKALTFEKMHRMKESDLARIIRPAGYYNIKARRIKNFLVYLKKNYNGQLKKMLARDAASLREELLAVCGIGPETADSILLYALQKPTFVVDAYTRRILSRHRLISRDADYESIRRLFMEHLSLDTQLFNEYHALLVKLAKDYCKKAKKECSECPIHEK